MLQPARGAHLAPGRTVSREVSQKVARPLSQLPRATVSPDHLAYSTQRISRITVTRICPG